MTPRSVLVLSLAAGCCPALASAQPLLVPLEQQRYIAITLHARSGKTESVVVLSSEPEAFEPFYAGINGELIVDTAVAQGIGGHLSEIYDDGFRIAETCTAVANARTDLDSASTTTDATFRVRFQVSKPSTFEIFGYSDWAPNRQSEVQLSILQADGVPLWNLHTERPDAGYSGNGVLEAGEYIMIASNIVTVEVGPRDYARAQAALVVSFHLGPPPAHACPCDWNQDDFLDTADLFAFLHDFFDLEADFNGSGETDSSDLFAFLTCMLTGC